MRQIRVQRDAGDVVLGSAYGAESHGGGVLGLILERWKPEGRPARLADRFFFEATRNTLELEEIYRSHQRQTYLPVAGKAPDEIRGRLPVEPQLARMRFRYAALGQAAETKDVDAYHFLQRLALHEPDLSRSWINRLEQRLSAGLLLRQAWERYLASGEESTAEPDHSWLHLPGILLSYRRRVLEQQGGDGQGLDANRIKQRLLAVELRQTRFEAEDWSESLAHHAESLGLLLAEPAIAWQPSERRAVRSWLSDLETTRFRELAGLETDELCHLLAGLRLVDEHRERLD
jgi:hypothetical protein